MTDEKYDYEEGTDLPKIEKKKKKKKDKDQNVVINVYVTNPEPLLGVVGPPPKREPEGDLSQYSITVQPSASMDVHELAKEVSRQLTIRENYLR